MTKNSPINLTRRSFLIASGVCVACSAPPGPVDADARMVRSEAPGFYRVMIGDYEVTVLSDGKNPLAATKLLQGDPSRIADALKNNFLGEQVETSHNSFLINTGDKLALVDAGAGTLLCPQTGKLLGNLRAAGYQPEQVDEVYLTHLHTDHIGGLMAGDQRAFPNAVVRADIRDTDYWLSAENMRAAPAETKRFFEASTASLSPYREAGKLNTFEGGADLIPGIQAQPAYGHTPDTRCSKWRVRAKSFSCGAISSMSPQCSSPIRRSRLHTTSTRWRPNRSTGASSMTPRRIGT
jgi:glyoxylase-like metal-dependent hydrolase (beta-lactamase superfamily II)